MAVDSIDQSKAKSGDQKVIDTMLLWLWLFSFSLVLESSC